MDGTARELLAEPDSCNQSAKSVLDAACDFLRDVLSVGLSPSKSVQDDAKNAGISAATLRRAKDRLGVQAVKGAEGWYWRLPAQGAQGVQHSNVEHVEHLEHVELEDAEVF